MSAPGEAFTGFRKLSLAAPFPGRTLAAFLITNDGVVPFLGPEFRPQNGAGQGSRTLFFFALSVGGEKLLFLDAIMSWMNPGPPKMHARF